MILKASFQDFEGTGRNGEIPVEINVNDDHVVKVFIGDEDDQHVFDVPLRNLFEDIIWGAEDGYGQLVEAELCAEAVACFLEAEAARLRVKFSKRAVQWKNEERAMARIAETMPDRESADGVVRCC